MNQLIEFVDNYVLLEENEKVMFGNALKVKKFRSNEVILQNNKTCQSLLFITSGSAKSSFINAEGQEYIWNFYFNDQDSNFENFFLFDYNSFLQQIPTPFTFQAIDDVEVIELHYEKFQSLLKQFNKMQVLARLMTEQAYKATHKRTFSLLTQSAKERYLKLLEESPYLLNKFQHYLIASYLGIAPQSLSRLRKEIYRR